jgi:phytanoyl-CoA hydroxylase
MKIIKTFKKHFSIKSIENIMTSSKIKQYQEEGFAVLPNVFPKDYIDELKFEVADIVSKANINELKTKFDTGHSAAEDYFLESGDKIRFFLEKDAFDKNGKMNYPLKDSINKIGHAMHDINPKFVNFSYSNEMKYIANSIGYKKPILVQSMYIFKNARIGGEVPPHTDNTYIRTNPSSCMGIWVAFDDAESSNGGMWGVPGSHKTPTNWFLKLKCVNGKKYTVYEPSEKPIYDTNKAVKLEVEKGSVILLHGDFVHFSYANASEKQRHAYTLHLVEGKEHTYEPDNWLQRKDIRFKYMY